MSVVFRLQSPYRSAYELHRITLGSGSPTVCFVAGLHGNELNGIYAVNMLISTLRMQPPKGTVHVFPLVNTFGADEGSKFWPFDGQDLNRACPGHPEGTAAERIAHALVEHSAADVCVDIHSGAAHVRELPQVRVPMSGDELELGRAMGLPVVWRRPEDRLGGVGLVGSWRERNRKALHVVGGRGVTLDTDHSTTIARGLTRLLAKLGMLPQVDAGTVAADVTHAQIESHRASCGGFFVPQVRVGAKVQPGHMLGHIQAAIGGERLVEVRAERPGIVMTVRAYPMVHAQELLVRIAGD